MPEAIESKSFRAAARRNCIKYLDIPIYVDSIPDLIKMELPSFRAQSPEGAAAQLFATLVNMSTQIQQVRANLRMTDSKPVPGVTYGDIGSLSLSLNGAVYFENAGQYNAFVDLIERTGREYGWAEVISSLMSTSVYRPAKNDFSNIDPVQAAIKGAVLGTVSGNLDAGTILAANSANEKEYFAARDRYLGGSIFNTAAIQYYSNTPVTVRNKWAGMGGKTTPTIMIDNEPHGKANIAYMPTAISITPGAFVVDSSGYYPTKCAISIQMANPLGGLFANYSVVESAMPSQADESGAVATIPENYRPKI